MPCKTVLMLLLHEPCLSHKHFEQRVAFATEIHISLGKKVSMGLTDRRKTAKKLVGNPKNWKILTVSRK